MSKSKKNSSEYLIKSISFIDVEIKFPPCLFAPYFVHSRKNIDYKIYFN